MLEFMKLGFKQVAFGGEGGGGGGGSDNAPTSSPRPTPRPAPRPAPPPPRDDGPSDAERNRQALLASQMQQEQRNRAAQEAAAVEADRQRQAAAQAEANRQAQAAREAAERQRQAAAQAEANRQAQAAREAADRQRQQQEAARRAEEQQRQEDEARQRADEQRRQEQALAAQRAQEQRERDQREAAAVAAEAARRAQEDADRRAADQARLAEQRNQEAAARRAQEEAAIRAEQARAGIETLAPPVSTAPTYTPRDDTFVDSILSVDDILAPTAPLEDDAVFQGPTLEGPGYTQDPNITVDVDPDTGFITSETISAPSGILTTQQAVDQAAEIRAQQQAYQDMLARAQAAEAARQPATPVTPAPVDFVPSTDLRDDVGSLLPPVRSPSGLASIGFEEGQIDPSLARAAGIQEGQPAFGQTTAADTLTRLYGGDPFDVSPENLTDLALATGRTQDVQQLIQARPDLVFPPPTAPLVMGTGQVPAGTPGATGLQDVFGLDEVQMPLDASFESRQVYESLGLTPFQVGTVSESGQATPVVNYRDAQGRIYSQAEARDFLRARGAQTTTLPGGYVPIAPLTSPAIPAIDLGITPVEIALPVVSTGTPGGGPRGGPGRGDPRDFGFSAEEAAAAAQRTASPAGIEGLLDRSPTLGQPAATTVPQAADIIMPGVETSPSVEVEAPTPLVAPGGETAPEVDLTVPPPEVVGGEPDAAEDVEVTVDTGVEDNLGDDTEGFGYDMNGDGRISLTERIGDMLDGGGPGQSGDQFEGGGVLSDIGNALGGPGTGTGAGPGDGDGTGGGQEPDVEVEIPDEDAGPEEELPVEEEEPSFECPPGFRRVQMANGGFTCVPEMVRPRVGPYTQPVSVAPLAGRTPFRPGTRRT